MTESTAADANIAPLAPTALSVAESALVTEQPTSAAAEPANAADASAAPAATAKAKSRPAKSDVMPVLEQLAALYPALFGAQFLPLKRGIFQDLQDAHPEVFEREALKAALSMHTRSTRYLSAVSSGQQRHD